MQRIVRSLVAASLIACSLSAGQTQAREAVPIESLQAAAKKAGSVLEIPQLEQTPEALANATTSTLAAADQRLASLGAQDLAQVSWGSTIGALDEILYPVIYLYNRASLIKETSPDSAMRAAGTESVKTVEQWIVATRYREDVYRACKAYADALEAGREPALEGERLKLYKDTMRDYRRAGLSLDKATRDRVEALQKRLSDLSNDFNTNITDAQVTIFLDAEDLEGVPMDFLEPLKTVSGRYALRATVAPHFLMVMNNAVKEETRRAMKMARYSVAMDRNAPILDELVALRDEIASLLGYASWADYQTEPRMAGSGKAAVDFVEELAAGLEPKFRREVAEFQRLKAEETGDPNAQVRLWDWRYYENQLKKREFSVDAEQLRNYFEFERTLAGMFDIYESIFGLEFRQVRNPAPWFEGVTLWAALDSATGEPMGLFYMDNFPREGKYNHFAQFDIVPGKLMADGTYRRPVVALICNFTPPTADKPSLLSHSEVETLFHEFGHALHSILTRAETCQLSGTNVPRDFVEAPSQMLENWVWDATILNRFAADWRDPSRTIDPALIERMNEARLATMGVFYRRQLALALGDLRIHLAGRDKDTAEIINDTFDEIFFPVPEGSNFAAYWGHLTGYDAGYYGYAWADSIAADMATVFELAPGGWLDKDAGMRLRTEIYAPGGAREIDESIRAFLGRDRSTRPFLKSIGVEE